MFKIESYVAPLLLGYIDKYVKDFNPADAQLSLWGGDLALHNLVLKPDVLQLEVPLPFTLVSSRIHELLVQVPWTKIISEPITVTIDTIECILSFRPPVNEENIMPDRHSRTTQSMEAPPGYMQALVRRIVSNISVKIHHLIVKYVQDDIVLSLNIKHLSAVSAGPNWEPAFADIDQSKPVIRRIVTLDDLTLCLDQSDSDGKIRFYQEPLLYRCQLTLRVLTKLVSATIRRASSINMQLRSSRLAWGITNEQLGLVLRLVKEHQRAMAENQHMQNKAVAAGHVPSQNTTSTSTEPTKSGSWTEWAWSWLPSWSERESQVEQMPMGPTTTKVFMSVYLDEMCFIFKVMEYEGTRRRPRGVLELCSDHLAFKSFITNPYLMRAKVGIRNILLQSSGKCVCGYLNTQDHAGERTVYFVKKPDKNETDEFTWPPDNLEDDELEKEECAEAEPNIADTDSKKTDTDSKKTATDSKKTDTDLKKEPKSQGEGPVTSTVTSIDGEKSTAVNEKSNSSVANEKSNTSASFKDDKSHSQSSLNSQPGASSSTPKSEREKIGNEKEYSEPQDPKREEKQPQSLWRQMSPLVLIEFNHERQPPMFSHKTHFPPPTDFEYSDWEEDCTIRVVVKPVDARLCMGIIHRLYSVLRILRSVNLKVPDPPMRTLTVEECDALLDNLPQRRINIEMENFRLRVHPWDHTTLEKPTRLPIVLDFVLPKAIFTINGALYPHRVCSAACQMPKDAGPIWVGARSHITITLDGILVNLCALYNEQPKPCARADLSCALHILQYPDYFEQRQSVVFGYSANIREINISGSAARLRMAWQIVLSLIKQKGSLYMRQTTLGIDALNDEEGVVLDLSIEDVNMRGYMTKYINTHICSIHSIRATAIHKPSAESEGRQAWIFSAPDVPAKLASMRVALQWSWMPLASSLDYLGLYMESMAFSLDPLFFEWLAYKPQVKSQVDPTPLNQQLGKTVPSSVFFRHRRTSPSMPSSSGRGGSRTSLQEQVHVKPQSVEASSEPSEPEKRHRTTDEAESKSHSKLRKWWKGEGLLDLHGRLKHMLLNIETGMLFMYVCTTTAPAVDFPSMVSAMEAHACEGNPIVVFCLGRWNLHTNSSTKYLWQEVKHDGPTILDAKLNVEDSFPWKMRIVDISCFTMDAKSAATSTKSLAAGLKSQLKVQRSVVRSTIVEHFTTTVLFSVLTKSVQYVVRSPAEKNKQKSPQITKGEAVLKYFSTGEDFKPSSLQEFMRGPQNRERQSKKEAENLKKPMEQEPVARKQVIDGPTISMGFHIHADTPPITVKIDNEQLYYLATAVHCITHFLDVMKRESLHLPKTQGYSHDLNATTAAKLERNTDTKDGSSSGSETNMYNTDLVSIFEATSADANAMKRLFWFQWIISSATVTVASYMVKIIMTLDDVMATVDLQEHYNQLKVKVENFAIQYQQLNEDEEWTMGPLDGRIIVVREPTNAQEDANFLSITITQALLSNLPPSWKEELHPKLLDPTINPDLMWEVYANVAPLEVIVQPSVLGHIVQTMLQLDTRWICTTVKKQTTKPVTVWPFLYLNSGGLRVIMTQQEESQSADDTFVFTIGKITVNPHPDNPIARKPIHSNLDTSWLPGGQGLEGRQYEMSVKNINVKTGLFQCIINEDEQNTGGNKPQNPARKWGQNPGTTDDILTQVLHPLSIVCVAAPPLYHEGVLNCGPGVELNLTTDCSIEISLDQIALMRTIIANIEYYIGERATEAMEDEPITDCPYAKILRRHSRIDLLSTTQLTMGHSDITCTESKGNVLYDGGDEDGEKSEKRTTFFAVGRPTTNVYEHHNENNTKSASGKDSVSDGSKKDRRNADNVQDSGLESTSRSSFGGTKDTLPKKTYSIGFQDQPSDPSEHVEVYVTVGLVEMAVYTIDSSLETPASTIEGLKSSDIDDEEEQDRVYKGKGNEKKLGVASNKSLTAVVRDYGKGQSDLNINQFAHYAAAKSREGHIVLMCVSFYQPNLYYYKRRSNKQLQFSLFDIWVSLNSGSKGGHRQQVLLSTAKGVPDPVTEIKPALLTVKLITVGGALSSTSLFPHSTLTVDMERPVLLELSRDSLARIKEVSEYIRIEFPPPPADKTPKISVFHKIRRFMQQNDIDVVTIQTTQMGLQWSDWAVGFDSASLQLGWNSRPEQLLARGLISALVAGAGLPNDNRRVLLQPTHVGVILEAVWEAWRRSETRMPTGHDPTLRLCIDLDNISIDIRPEDLEWISNLLDTFRELSRSDSQTSRESWRSKTMSAEQLLDECAMNEERRMSLETEFSDYTLGANVGSNHFYKDDLRSGAFKIVHGSHLPMAYQVVLHKNLVSWRYPQPRTITRLVLYPIPDNELDLECVLELFNRRTGQWMQHALMILPTVEPKQIHLFVPSPEAIFCNMWRFRLKNPEEVEKPYVFNIHNFSPRADPLLQDPVPESEYHTNGVSAEELWGALRVDSYFSPRLLPRVRLTLRMASFDLHAHNSLPRFSSKSTELEGYYVTKPLMRTHRVLSVGVRNLEVNSFFNSPAGALVMIKSNVSSKIVECTSGIIVPLVNTFKIQGALSLPTSPAQSRLRFCASTLHLGLHIPRLRTLQALAMDWQEAAEKYQITRSTETETWEKSERIKAKYEMKKEAIDALEGRVCLWINNKCTQTIRVGQEGTDEVVPLGPGVKLAYRWCNPTAKKRLRVAISNPTGEWHWSKSFPFTPGSRRIRLEDSAVLEGLRPGVMGQKSFVYVKTIERGASREMRLTGRLQLSNMLRHNLQFKVRAFDSDVNQWQTVASGDLLQETVERSVLCEANCDMILKIRLTNQETGWSGDIPLKECPKENVPWLVKVPTEGDIPYMSVWCRVTRSRTDFRLIATIWPLYVLRSNLSLDIDVLVSTDLDPSQPRGENRPPPLVQPAPGRGGVVHLLTAGTTSARHLLSFQYINLECPVTREAVPLHYGVTDTSVFEKTPPVNNVDDITAEIRKWLARSGSEASSEWPFSIVMSHWAGDWCAALMQPQCEVSIRYEPIRVGGGCSLEMVVSPVVLMCNAAPVPVVLRAHDAAPLCKLEPGHAISAPYVVLKKPFFISLEVGRDTFVSRPLKVCDHETGRYGIPPPGQVAPEHPISFAVLCNQKVALLMMHYEIKENINVLGITTTYTIVNRLPYDIQVSAIAVPKGSYQTPILNPNVYKNIPPTPAGTFHGVLVCRFWLHDRWRGRDASELEYFLCVSLTGDTAAPNFVPVRLAMPPIRRAIALLDQNNTSIPLVVTQQKYDGRWVVSVAKDPCPQFLVSNQTSLPIVIAQPVDGTDEPSTSAVVVVPDCEGVKFSTVVSAKSNIHYSTPAYCARHPPEQLNVSYPIPSVTFGNVYADGTQSPWCAPVATTEGEQLLQLNNKTTVKLRVRIYPHSTLLELRDVDRQLDISASDIRRRIQNDSVLTFAEKSVTTVVNLDKEEGLDEPKKDSDESLVSKNKTKRKSKLEETLYNEEDETDILVQKIISQASDLTKSCRISQEMERKMSKTDEFTKTEEPPIEEEDLSLKPKFISLTDEARSETAFHKHKKGRLKSEKGRHALKPKLFHETIEADNPKSITKFPKTSPSLKKLVAVTMSYESLASAVTLAADRSPDISSIVLFSREGVMPEHLDKERVRILIAGIVVDLSTAADVRPLVTVHLDRISTLLSSTPAKTKIMVSIGDIQVDNLQYDSGQFDFAVIATTRDTPLEPDPWPPVTNMFLERTTFATKHETARFLLHVCQDRWIICSQMYNEITEVEIRVGPLALYIEDAYVTSLAELLKIVSPSNQADGVSAGLAEFRALQCPIRLRALTIQPMVLTLTLHTAVRMYIALDQSPLRLSAFKARDMMTSSERLVHALTVHYLSAAILGAGWVVGGLELLGAPGALAARVGGATGGVRGVASAAAAGLLRSLSAWAGSLARNLDLLAGDEEHAKRAAAARRHPPDNLVAGLVAGFTNFGINILGAVGGLAHHPLVGMAVGETASSTAALRRGLLGAFTKPLSATADLVAYAGHGLLKQTGWDPVPQPRSILASDTEYDPGWERDCVRWTFRLADLLPYAGFEVLLDNAGLLLLLTHKYIVVTEKDYNERVVEMIELRHCELLPYTVPHIELIVKHRRTRTSSARDPNVDDDEYQVTAAAMARVARYTGAESATSAPEQRVLSLLPRPNYALPLHCALAVAIHSNSDTHFHML